MARFQYSTKHEMDSTTTEAWTTDAGMHYWTMVDSLGNRSRIAQVCITNPLGAKERRYFIMQRVRLLDSYGVVTFLGRILNIDPHFEGGKILLTCRDFLGDLSEKVVEGQGSDGSYTAKTRNWLIAQLLENEAERPESGGDIERSLVPRMLQDPGNYLEKITKRYAEKGNYGIDRNSSSTSNYDYRGTKTVLEAITEIASEDAQQDLMLFYYNNFAVSRGGTTSQDANNLANPKSYPSTYWVDYTSGLQDGDQWFPTPRALLNSSTSLAWNSGTDHDALYIGSNSKFDGIEYTFRQSGTTIHESNYTAMEWQFWDGQEWITFSPDTDSMFTVDESITERVVGRTTWSSLIELSNKRGTLGPNGTHDSGLAPWRKRDLAESPTMPTFNDWNDQDTATWDTWRAPWHYSGNFGNNVDHWWCIQDTNPDTGVLEFFEGGQFPTKGMPLRHGLRNGDTLVISGVNGTFNGTHYVKVVDPFSVTLHPTFTGDRDYGEDTFGTAVVNTGSDLLSQSFASNSITIGGTVRPTDVTSDAIPNLTMGGTRGTYRYWVRCWPKTASASVVAGQLTTVELATRPNLYRDFRAEDPKFFDEVWHFTTHPSGRTLSNESYHHYSGGVWTALNTAGDRGLGDNNNRGEPLLWDDTANDVEFFGTRAEVGANVTKQAYFFGSDEPVSGIELYAVQGVTLRGSSITAASPANITTVLDHGLSTGDYVFLQNSNSGISIDGYRTVVKVDAKNFTVVVNNTSGAGGSAGTSVTVRTGVPDYGTTQLNIDLLDSYPKMLRNTDLPRPVSAWRTINRQVAYNSFTHTEDISWAGNEEWGQAGALSPIGPARWRLDTGQSEGGLNHWYCEIRWNNDRPRNEVTLRATDPSPDVIYTPWAGGHHWPVTSDEHDKVYPMTYNSAWTERTTMMGSYAAQYVIPSAPNEGTNYATAVSQDTTANSATLYEITMRTQQDVFGAVGDWISFSGSRGNTGFDGSYRITEVDLGNKEVKFNVGRAISSLPGTGSGNPMVIQYTAQPPNNKSLYWVRMRATGTPRVIARLRSVRTASQARFKYFDRGKEPWSTNDTSASTFGANDDLDAVYTYDASISTNSIDVASTADQDGFLKITLDSSHYRSHADWVELVGFDNATAVNGIWKIMRGPSSGVAGNAFVINYPGSSITISNNEKAYFSRYSDWTAEAKCEKTYRTINVTNVGEGGDTGDDTAPLITTEGSHRFQSGDLISLSGVTTTPSISGYNIVSEVLNHNQFTIENVDGSIDAVTGVADGRGTAQLYILADTVTNDDPMVINTRVEHDLSPNHRIYFISTTAGGSITTTPNLSAWYTVLEVLSPTSFSIPVDNTGSAVTNVVFYPSPSNIVGQSSGTVAPQQHDAVLFGRKKPFNTLRFNLEDRFEELGYYNGVNVRTWEFYRAGSWGYSDGWSVIPYWDPTVGFSGAGSIDDVEVTFTLPGLDLWKTTQPGIKTFPAAGTGQTVTGLDGKIGESLYYIRMRFTSAASANGGSVQSDWVRASRIWSGPNYWDKDLEVGTLPGVSSERHTTNLEFNGLTFDDRQKTLSDRSTIQVMEYEVKDHGLEFANKITVRGQAGAYATVTDQESIDTFSSVKEKIIDDSSLTTDTQCYQRARSLLEQLKPKPPISILNISKANPTVVTTGGSKRYLAVYIGGSGTVFGGTNNTRVRIGLFERQGFKIIRNSAPDSGNSYRTYIETDRPHGLATNDIVYFTDIGLGGYHFSRNSDASVSGYVHEVTSTSPTEFYVSTGNPSSYSGTSQGAIANNVVGGVVHPMARTDLRINDFIRIRNLSVSGLNQDWLISELEDGIVNSAANQNCRGGAFKVKDPDSGTEYTGTDTSTTNPAGYALISETHSLTTADKVLLRNTTSLPSIDGYRVVTRTGTKTFTVDLDLTASNAKAGISGTIRPTSIRQATIITNGWPVYTVNKMPRALRAGDMSEVFLRNAGIFGEQWLTYSITYDGAICEIVLFRDKDAVAEPGDAEKRLLRDMSERLRETANAVFQPIDKAVQAGLDFLPEGPGRTVLRIQDETHGLDAAVVDTSDNALSFPDDFKLSFKMFDSYGSKELVSKDVLRVDTFGLRPDGTGDATGGGGVTFVGRDATSGVTGATPNFHPADGEATLYLRDSATANQGSGLYLSHRGVFNSAATYDEWDTDTPKLQAEVFVGLSGRATANGSGVVTIVLPALSSNPRILANTESNGYVQVTNSTTSATLTARDAAGSAIGSAVINYVVVYNSTSNTGGLNTHYNI